MKRMKRSLALILSLALALNSSLLVLAEDVSADAGQAVEVAEKVTEENAPVEGQAEPAVEEEIPPAEETSAAEEVEAQTVDEETEITLDGLLNTHPGTFLFTAPEDGEYRFRMLSADTDVLYCDRWIEGADGTPVDFRSISDQSELSYVAVHAALTGGTQYKIVFSGDESLTVDLEAEKLKAVKSLEIVQLPSDASFVVGTYEEDRLLDGLIVKAVYEDDSEEEIAGDESALDDRRLSDYIDSTNVDQGNPGTYPVYISYGGEQITLTVTISNDDSEIVVDVDEAHFPDEEFRDYVASYVDANGDKKLSEYEISLEKECTVSGRNISSLKGIEYLTSVDYLECDDNNLTELDLSSNTELIDIYCKNNQLTSIDLGGLTELRELECSNNCLTELDLSSSPDIWNLENEFQTVDGTTYSGWNEDGVYDADHELLSDAYECAGKQIRLVQQKLSGIQFDSNEITISKGDSQDVSIQPSDPYVTEQFGATIWSIEPEGTDVFSIDEDVDGGNGHARIKGDNLGTATLKAAVGEHTAECTITVQDASIGAVPVDEEHFPNAAFRQYIEDKLDKNQNNSLSRTELANVTEINVRGQGVSDLTGIEYFTNLKHLECGENGLTSLDVSALTKLEYLEASNNQLSELDFTNNLKLTKILLDYQKSGEKLYSGWNEEGVFDREHWLLREGDFPGKVIKLVTQDATGVYVTRSVIMQPGEKRTFNANLTGSFFTESTHDYSWSTESGTSEIISLKESNYNDNGAYITANKVGTEIVTVRTSSYSTTFKVTVTEGTPVEITDQNFPDESFRSYVKNECDSDEDGILSFEEQLDQTQMSLSGSGITDLTGIEYFVNLTYLDCQYNKLTTLDVTMLGNLRVLICSSNELTSLDLTGLGALSLVDVQRNKLKEIELSGCESLSTFYSANNRLTKLDFSDCNKLENVWIDNQGGISSFASSDWYYDQEFTQKADNGSGLYDAVTLCGKTIYLKEKEIRQIFISPVNLTLGLPDTGEYHTSLTSAPPDEMGGGRVSGGCPEEAEIVLADPSLADIKVKDGCDKTEGYFTVIPKKTGTTTVTVTYKDVSCTSNLTIQDKSVEIEVNAENFPDPVFRAAVTYCIDQDHDGILSATELAKNTSIWSMDGTCRSLKGIELLTNLQSVSITSPFLKEADLSKNPELTYIRIESPALNNLNIEGLTKVMMMYISGTRRLGNVDVSKLKDLRVMELSGAGITSVDVTKNTKLSGLILTNTSVQSVDLTKNPELSGINFQGGEIKHLDLSQNKKLDTLALANLPMEELNLANNPDIYQLDIQNLPLTTFDPSPLKGLDFLYLTGSQLESIDLRENKELLQIHLNNSVGGEMGWYLDQAYAKPWGGDLETAKNNVLYRNPAYEAPIYDSPTYDIPTYGSPSAGGDAVNGLILDEGFVYGRLSTGILEEIATNKRILTILKNLGVTGVSCSLLQASGVYRTNNINDTSAATFTFMGDAIDEGDQLIVLRRSDMDAAKNGENKWERIPAAGVKLSEDAVTVTADQIGLPFAVLKVTSESKSLEDAVHAAVSGITDKIYDGTEKKQSSLTVTYDGAELSEDTDYTVTYKNHKNIGTATVTITGKGDYEGTVTKSFQINMPKTAGLVTSAEKTTGMTLKWTKDAGVTGYEVQYSTSATFASGVTTKKITSNTNSLAVTGLSAGKSYYYRVRAYATISKKTTYGSYSETYKAVTATAAPEKPVVKGVTDEQSVNVSWKKVSGASKYVVYRSTKATSGYKNIATLSGATVTYKDTGLDAGKTYFYKIRTYRAGTGHNVYSEYSVYNACATATTTPVISKVIGGTGKITVSWGSVSGATRYEVYWGSSKTNMTKAATLGSSTTSYTKTGLSAGKTYYVKIYTCRTVNKADVYNQSCAIRYGATSPAVPAISSVSGGVETASVTWKAVSGASGYAVYMSTSATTGYKLVESISGRANVSYEATGLAAAEKYYFKIRSYRNGDNAKVYSGYSAVQSCETATATPVISSVKSESKAVTVKWSNVDKESGYELYMASSETGTYSKIASLKANVTSYKKTGLATGRKYYFKVYTYRTVGGEEIRNEKCAVKGGATMTATPSIASLTAAVTQTTVKWKAVSGASGYQVYMATSSGGTYSKKASVSGGTKTSAVIKNLTPGKKYYFRIRTYISGSKLTTATGSFSAVKSCTTQVWPAIETPQMKAYEGADYQFDENGTLTISWAALSGVTGYEVEKKKGEGIYQLVEEVTEADPDGSYTYHEAEFAQDDIYTLRVRAYKIVSGERVYAQDEEAQYGKEIQILLAS